MFRQSDRDKSVTLLPVAMAMAQAISPILSTPVHPMISHEAKRSRR